jgi:pimeloyl-ACP methyl ester carboxylesterase
MAFVRQTIDLNGCKLSFARGGAGVPLLYLHGTDGLAEWPAILDTLAQRFDVVAPDHPGFGASEVPAWIDDVSDVAYLYLDAIEKLGLSTSSGSRSADGSRSRWRCARRSACAV